MNRISGSMVITNVVTLVATLVLNGLATGLPLNGRTTGEISDSFPNVFAPAGYVFSIWGIIYILGWISVATIANAAVTLLDLGWDGGPLSPGAWTVGLIAVAVGLGLWFIVQREDLAYSFVLIWAFIGIAVKQVEPWVPEGATIASALLALVAVWRIVTWLTGPRSSLNRSIAPGIAPS
ncbi:MAG: hypothetical protein EBZ89_01515 [Chloroflexi bacterium]|nr:hypothetical protein [Chloroflexota bacterium]